MRTAALVSLLACGAFTSCATGPGPAEPVLARFLPVLETFADAAVRLHLTAAMQERAPLLFPVLDVDHNGELTLGELRAADLADPVLVTAVLLTIERLVRER